MHPYDIAVFWPLITFFQFTTHFKVSMLWENLYLSFEILFMFLYTQFKKKSFMLKQGSQNSLRLSLSKW